MLFTKILILLLCIFLALKNCNKENGGTAFVFFGFVSFIVGGSIFS